VRGEARSCTPGIWYSTLRAISSSRRRMDDPAKAAQGQAQTRR
jgi:hypothetical protein